MKMSLKFLFVLCLLSVGCNAKIHIRAKHVVAVARIAMRHLMRGHAANDDPMLINRCFNTYMNDQTVVVAEYNTQYNGCLQTAQDAKDHLTAQSADKRDDLLTRGNSMCGTLSVCDQHVDGLEFFDCYRNASSDSYKVMFTLNSDSNAHFNYLSASYSVIETDLLACIDEARVDYAKKMDAANEDLQTCLNGGEAETTTAQPSNTTVEAESSTLPSTTSGLPVETTTPAESTTEAEESSTEPAETTTDAVETTTEAEETTTEAEETTTVAVESSTGAEPETTTERLPEEDIDRAEPSVQKHAGILNMLRHIHA